MVVERAGRWDRDRAGIKERKRETEEQKESD